MSLGFAQAYRSSHRQTCRVEVILHYSAPDLGVRDSDAYPGPPSKPIRSDHCWLEWHSGVMPLNAKAPVSGSGLRKLGQEIGEAVTLQMFREPPDSIPIAMLDSLV